MPECLSGTFGSLCDFVRHLLDGDEQRFKTAQILYIMSVCCACFLDDTVRRLLFLGALLIINKKQRHTSVMADWCGLVKLTGYCLIAFGLWVMIVPLFVGDESLLERFLGVPRPLEIALWIWGAWVFAKDTFFYKNMALIATYSCMFVSTVFLIQRTSQSFADMYVNKWVFSGASISSGMHLLFLMPWLFYALSHENKLCKIIAHVITIVMAAVVLISTYALTIWVAFFAQIVMLLFTAYFNTKLRLHTKSFKVVIAAFMICAVFICAIINLYPNAASRITAECNQLSTFDKNTQTFTTNRVTIWEEVINIVEQRPLCGYGWVDYTNKYATVRYDPRDDISSTHSSYLAAAFNTGLIGLALFLILLVSSFVLCARKIFFAKKDNVLYFVALLSITAYCVASLTESLLLMSRDLAILFWVPVCLLLSNKDNIEEEESACVE